MKRFFAFLVAILLLISSIDCLLPVNENGYTDSSPGQSLIGGSSDAHITNAFPLRYSPYWQSPTGVASYGAPADTSLSIPGPPITPLDAILLGVLAACGVSLVGIPMLALLGLINPFNNAGLKPFRMMMPPTAITTVQANSPLSSSAAASNIVQTTASQLERKFNKRATENNNSWAKIAQSLDRLIKAQNILRTENGLTL